MNFYKSIANYYEYIFPFKKAAFDFVMNNITDNKVKLLDIGCATGELSLALAKEGLKVTAIDLDEDMILKAKNNDINNLVKYKVANMKNIGIIFKEKEFDYIISFGNTIVHLKNENEIKKLFQDVYNLLNNNGKILIQILNYDYILKNNIRKLPLIENDKILFERFYEIKTLKEENQIIFKTRLLIKDTKKEIKNEITLYPIKKETIEVMLKEIGFDNIIFYSSFEKKEYNNNLLPLVFEAQKVK